MLQYIAIRTYKLKPDVDKAVFEKVFGNVNGTLGLQKVILLKGYQGNQSVSKGEADYVSLHIFDSPEACAAFFQPAYEGINAGKEEADILSHYPEELRPFLQVVNRARLGETAESMVHGYTLVHGII